LPQLDLFAAPEPVAPPAAAPVRTPVNLELNALFGEYLEHSIRYYLLDNPVVPDGYFDTLCQTLLASWPQVTHRYRGLCDESALSAGTGFQLPFHKLEPIVWLCRHHLDTPLKHVFGAC
jgi:hypothetical protein